MRLVKLLVPLGVVSVLAGGTVPSPAPAAPLDSGSWSPVMVLQSDAWNVAGESVVTTSRGLTVARWSARHDGRSGTFFAVRQPDQAWGQPRIVLEGRLTELVIHDAFATVGTVHDGRFKLRSLRPDGTWGAVRTAPAVPVYRYATYHLDANDRGDLVVWWQRGDSTELTVRRAGGAWQRPEAVPIGSGAVESLTLDDSAAVDVVYTPKVTEVARHRIFHVRRSPSGSWGGPTTLARGDLRPEIEVAVNDDGDLAVAWPQDTGSSLFSLLLRYRPADGSWGPAHVLTDRMPESQFPALSMAASGRLSAAWVQRQDDRLELRFARRAVDGTWDERQLIGTGPDVSAWFGTMAGNAEGRTSLVLGAGTGGPGVEVVRCPATGACLAPRHTNEPAYTAPFVDLGPAGTVKLIWAAGCRTEACYATSARYRDLTW